MFLLTLLSLATLFLFWYYIPPGNNGKKSFRRLLIEVPLYPYYYVRMLRGVEEASIASKAGKTIGLLLLMVWLARTIFTVVAFKFTYF